MNQPVKLSPIHQTAVKWQAQFEVAAGWQVAQLYQSVEAETAAARQHVALADASANGKISVQGEQAGAILQASDLAIGAGQTAEFGHIYRLRANLFFVSTPPGAEAAAMRLLTAAAQSRSDLVTVTDMTHGRAELLLVGPAAAELLGRLCGLDFHPSAFPNDTAKQSSVAKTTQLVIRRDAGNLPAYTLIGARSLAAYLWETILHAGRDLEITPVGQAAINKLHAADE
jgi:heterotetrameric sarcosine oxidase gamma subunit